MFRTPVARPVHAWSLAACLAVLCLALPAGGATLVVGQVTPLGGVASTQGRGYSTGLKLAFEQANAAGGVNGNTLALVTRDDGSRAETNMAQTRDLVASQRPLLLAGYVGGQVVGDLVASGLLARERLALVGFRDAQVPASTPFVYSVRASLSDQVERILQHVATLGTTRIGLIYEDGPDAPATLAMVQKLATQRQLQLVANSAIAPGSQRAGKSAEIMLQAAPQIVLVLHSAACSAFVEDFRRDGGTAQVFASADVDVEQLAKRLGEEHMRGISIAQVTPSPMQISLRLTRDFQSALRTGKIELASGGHAAFEGYIAGRVIVEALRRAGNAPTREGVVRALDGMDTFDLGGYVVGFRPQSHTGSHFVELSIVSGSGQLRR